MDMKINAVTDVGAAQFTYGTIDVYEVPLDCDDVNQIPYGKVTVTGGKAAFESVRTVIELAMENKIDATITGPLNKEALNLAGYHYSGHTEIYADFTGTKDYAMMLADEKLRVVHVSTHVSLRQACDRVKKERVYKCIHIAHDACRAIGLEYPRIAVAGLNPHAGENGLFGREEIDEIIPAIDLARGEGLQVEGPFPPDTIFSKAIGGMYDVVVVMYHDQGHIPLKVTGFVYDHSKKQFKSVQGVNITLGLPIIRVSVDHGTAFDKAGDGSASADSLCNAIEYGVKMAAARYNKVVFNAITPLLLLILLGYFLKQIQFLSLNDIKALDKLCFRIAIPIMLFYNIYNADFTQGFDFSLVLFLVSGYLIIFVLSYFIVPRIVHNLDDAVTIIHGICHGNLAVIGLPLIINLFGESNITVYSILVACTSPVINPLMVFEHEKLIGKQIKLSVLLKNMLTSPFLVGTVAGLIAHLLPIQIPAFIMTSVKAAKDMATPLCLVALGGTFAFSDFKKYSKMVTGSVLLRCVIIPGIVISVAVAVGFRGIELASLMIVFAAPSATATYSYCASYSGNSKLAAQIVMYSSLFSILSIFMWMFSFLQLGLI